MLINFDYFMFCFYIVHVYILRFDIKDPIYFIIIHYEQKSAENQFYFFTCILSDYVAYERPKEL